MPLFSKTPFCKRNTKRPHRCFLNTDANVERKFQGLIERNIPQKRQVFLCTKAKFIPNVQPADQQECILFCAGKTLVISNWSGLFQSHILRLCQFRVGVLYFAQVFTTFVVYSVTNSKSNASKNGQYCKFHYVRHYLKK